VVLLGFFGSLFYLLTRGQEHASQVIRRMAGRVRFLDADKTTALVEHLANRFRLLMENRSLTRRAIGWAAANWLLDAASLWVFVAAFSHFISPVDLLMAYGLANILAAIPITPGGLGVVEFVLVSMITGFGPTAGQALSAVLAYRAVNFWLPIPFGGLAYASLEFERHRTFRSLGHLVARHRPRRRAGAGAPTAGEPSGRPEDVRVPVGAGPAVASHTPPAEERPAPEPGEASEPVSAPAPGAGSHRGQTRGGHPRPHAGSHRGGAGGIREPAFGSDPGG
jgi:hypothetical protein